jgi:hypothetical protein
MQRSTQRWSFYQTLVSALAGAVCLIAGCKPQGTGTTPTTTTITTSATEHNVVRPSSYNGGLANTAWREAAAKAHDGYSDAAKRAAWAFEAPYGSASVIVPEYNDEQRLYDGGTGTAYGPTVHLFASPQLALLTSPQQWNALGTGGAVVGYIDVEDQAPGYSWNGAYTRLGIAAKGDYCISLAHTGGSANANWTSYIYSVDVNGYCQQPTSSPTAIVTARHDFVSGTLTDYPVGARFGHDKSLNPIILVKCLDQTCEIGVDPSQSDKAWTHGGGPGGKAAVVGCNGHGGGGSHTTKEWMVKGWHDEQRLSMDDGTGKGHLIPSNVCAAIVPVAGLDTHDKNYYTCAATPCTNADWKTVATIWLPAGTDFSGTKYESTWNMGVGENVLSIRRVGTKDDDDLTGPAEWDAEITNSAGTVLKYFSHIHRHSHMDMILPGTARFTWRDNDETLWVTCGVGCCEVDAGLSQ